MNTYTVSGPVHQVENVVGRPGEVQTTCGRFSWQTVDGKSLDMSKPKLWKVTCPECLEMMVDTPIIVEARWNCQ
jgi:hypothetical protein